MTLAEARTQIAELLDDANNVRWSTANIDEALDSAVDQCLLEYVAAGGDRFNEEVNASSSSSDGTLDLSSYNPLRIVGVKMKIGTLYYPLAPIARDQIERLDAGEARNLYIDLVRTPVLPTTTSHPLIGSGATSYGSDFTFDHWVCLRAARLLSAKDAEERPDLIRLEKEQRESVMKRPRVPQSRRFTKRKGWYGDFLRWSYEPRTQYLQLSQAIW